MPKRKFDQIDDDDVGEAAPAARTYQVDPEAKKHSLDSDEEDTGDEDNCLDSDDIEGEEDNAPVQEGEHQMTAFNMKEELEEGHFDKDGHFLWNNEKEIRDNWLDNIDWQKIKTSTTKYNLDPEGKGLADDTDSDSEPEEHFDELEIYKKIIPFMQPNENINQAIRRLAGDDTALSSVERLKRKKAGTLNVNEGVTVLTELANKILTKTGNMDIYQETYENIKKKIEAAEKKNKPEPKLESKLDMYAEDFSEKEKAEKAEKLQKALQMDPDSLDLLDPDLVDVEVEEVLWEFKWAKDNDKVEGPFTSKQMLKWTREGYFENGVWVRKHKENGPFYISTRLDFQLYVV